MEIHEIKGDATLQISINAREGDLVSDVGYSKIRKVRFCDGLVDSFILLDAPDKVSLSNFFRLTFVIRVA